MRKITNIVESHWLELGLFIYWAVFISITYLVPDFNDLPLRIGSLSMMVLYLLRMVAAFSHWKFSRGIAAILFMLNFLLFSEVETIATFFYGRVGFDQLMMVTNITAQVFALITIPVVIIKSSKKKIYWQQLNVTFFKAVVGFIICSVLKYL